MGDCGSDPDHSQGSRVGKLLSPARRRRCIDHVIEKFGDFAEIERIIERALRDQLAKGQGG